MVLGASEGMAVAFRSLLKPGDEVVVMQPYHELYPSQAAIFGLVPRFVTLREDREAGTWRLDRDEVRAAAADARGAGDHRQLAAESDRQGPRPGRALVRRGAVPGARPLRDHRRDLRAHHLRRASPPLPGRLRGDGRPDPGGELDFEDGPLDGLADRLGDHPAASARGSCVRCTTTWWSRRRRPLQKGAVALLRQERGLLRRNCRRRTSGSGICSSRGPALGRVHGATPPEGAYYLFADYRSVPALAKRSPMDAAMHLVTEVGGGDRCPATTSTPPATTGTGTSGSRSAVRSKRSKRASSGFARGSEPGPRRPAAAGWRAQLPVARTLGGRDSQPATVVPASGVRNDRGGNEEAEASGAKCPRGTGEQVPENCRSQKVVSGWTGPNAASFNQRTRSPRCC